MSITSKMVHVVKCDKPAYKCSFNKQFDDKTDAENAYANHQAEHMTAKIIGASLEGKVYHPNADGNPWRMNIHDALLDCKDDWAYMLWNGNVYTTVATGEPICRGEDVPGLAPW